MPIGAPPRFKASESQRHGEMAGGDDNRNRTQTLRPLRQKHAHNQSRAYSIVETRSTKFKSSQGSRKKLPEVFLKLLGRFQKSPGLCRQRVDPFVRKGSTLLKEGGIPLYSPHGRVTLPPGDSARQSNYQTSGFTPASQASPR